MESPSFLVFRQKNQGFSLLGGISPCLAVLPRANSRYQPAGVGWGYCKLWGPRSTRMACPCSMMFYMKVSWNRGTPKSSILVGFSLINHPAIGYSMYGTPPIWCFSPGRRSCHCTQSPRSMVWSDLAEAWWAVVTRTPVGPLKHGKQSAMFFICSRGSATVLMRRRVWGPQNKSICLFAVKPWC